MAFTCPDCGATSHNPNDEREGYCGACHWWTGNKILRAARHRLNQVKDASDTELRTTIRTALLARDEDELTTVAAAMGVAMRSETYEQIAREELAALPHEIHTFWEGPCNCTGVFN